jgi:hypothetical protein
MKILQKCLTLDEFKKYIKGKSFEPNQPNKIVLHHTWKPTQSTWNGKTTIDGLDKYYRGKGWEGLGPHIFIAPDGIWLFTDMKYQGIHAGEGNYRSIGIEVVGNYDGAVWTGSIKRNTLGVILALVDELGLEIMKDIRFHREFSKKSCPGKSITKDWLYEKLENYAEEYESVQERLPDVGKTIEDNTNSTITAPVEVVTGDIGVNVPPEPLQPAQPHREPHKKPEIINKTNNMNKFVKDKRVIMFFWNTLGAFLSVLAIYLGELSPEYSIILVPVILSITKYLNTKK